MTTTVSNHDSVVIHECTAYNLTPEQCFAAEPCATCGVRRDEHADQDVQSGFPALDISGHPFMQHPPSEGN